MRKTLFTKHNANTNSLNGDIHKDTIITFVSKNKVLFLWL